MNVNLLPLSGFLQEIQVEVNGRWLKDSPMQLSKLAIFLTASLLFLGCTSQPPHTKSSPTLTASGNSTTPDTSTLKEAVKELEVLEDKVKGGIDDRGYSVIIDKTSPLVRNARGDAKAVAAVKSAFAGHQLALRFWQCDRIEGYDALHQCRDKALSAIFAKYPDMEAGVKAAVKGKDVSRISAGLSKEGILQALWKRTSADTKAASQAISQDSLQKEL